MKFIETPLVGAYVVEMEPIADNRGYFARSYCEREFVERGLKVPFVQCNVSYNHQRGTIRGMHYQREPHGETKLIRCIRGAIYDVIVDIRPESASYGKWYGVELCSSNQRMLYVPDGFAHGFQTLENETEVFYQMGNFFVPESSEGLRWDDPVIGIEWPLPCSVISDKDQSYPGFRL